MKGIKDIIVVDGDRSFCDQMAADLMDGGYTVGVCTETGEILEQLENHVPDLIFVGLDALTSERLLLVQDIRRNHPGIRLYALSGNCEDHPLQILDFAMKMTVDGILCKEVDKAGLLSYMGKLNRQ